MEGLTNIRPSNATEIYILQANRLAQPLARACGAGEPCATVARVLPAEKAGIVRRLQGGGTRMAMVAMAVSVTAIFFNSLWGRPRLFFDAVLSVGQVAATTS
jgi:hypothetical protein